MTRGASSLEAGMAGLEVNAHAGRPDALLPIVVVPEGLARDARTGRTLPVPSFLYRAVLDAVAERWQGQAVYLSPANAFGGPLREQEAASLYLREKGLRNVHAPVPESAGYIDTWGNARYLRDHLEARGAWPLPPIVLAAGARHMARACLCFRRLGFAIGATMPVTARAAADEAIVMRLWYYRHPPAHFAYEALAIVRDYLRPRDRARGVG